MHLYDSGITSLSELRDLSLFLNLQVLNLHSNHITKIENLQNLVHLRELNLSSNDITRIEGLHRLVRLEVLNLASNRIKAVVGLEGMGNLKKINLSFNLIDDLSGFSALNGPHSKLHHLDMRANRINSLDELNYLARCSNLRYLLIKMDSRTQTRGNAISSQPTYRAHAFKTIPSLFSLDGYDSNMKLTHESDTFPSLAPYLDFLPDEAGKRPTSARVNTPRIDEVLQKRNNRPSSAVQQHPSRLRPPSAPYNGKSSDGSKSGGSRPDVKDRNNRVDSERQVYKPAYEEKKKDDHEERLAR